MENPFEIIIMDDIKLSQEQAFPLEGLNYGALGDFGLQSACGCLLIGSSEFLQNSLITKTTS
jgi:hypothetical protein